MAQPPTAAEIDFDTPGFRTGYVRLSHSDDRHAFSVIPVPVAVDDVTERSQSLVIEGPSSTPAISNARLTVAEPP